MTKCKISEHRKMHLNPCITAFTDKKIELESSETITESKEVAIQKTEEEVAHGE